MGKSKHPPLLKKALADIARVDKIVKKDITALKKMSQNCAATQRLALSSTTDFSTQLNYLKDVIDQYARKAVEIEQLETDMEDAKGDKKKEGELKKKLTKAEKEADAHRKEYDLAGQIFGTLNDVVREQVDQIARQSAQLNF